MASSINLAVFQNINFKDSDSPALLDVEGALGVGSSRAMGIINLGPGNLLVEISYTTSGVFEVPFVITARTAIAGESLNGVARIRITHTGIDSGYVVPASPVTQAINFQKFAEVEIYTVENYFSEFLLDGSTIDMSVDGSITPVEYSFTVPTDKRIRISRALLTIEDGNQLFKPEQFGRLSELSNGLEISVTPFGGSKQIMETWKTNREIRNTMFDFNTQFRQDGQYVGRWSLAKDFSDSGLYMNEACKISVLVQDALQGLDFLSLRIKGRIISV